MIIVTEKSKFVFIIQLLFDRCALLVVYFGSLLATRMLPSLLLVLHLCSCHIDLTVRVCAWDSVMH